jgi:hypothetical protein
MIVIYVIHAMTVQNVNVKYVISGFLLVYKLLVRNFFTILASIPAALSTSATREASSSFLRWRAPARFVRFCCLISSKSRTRWSESLYGGHT